MNQITSVVYDEFREILVVSFSTRSVTFFDVPQDVYKELLHAKNQRAVYEKIKNSFVSPDV